MFSAVGFASLAYHHTPARGQFSVWRLTYTKRNLYAAAAISAFALVPYTRLLMWENITELSKRAKDAEEGKEHKDTHELARTWGRLNAWRGLILLNSAALGISASLNLFR